MKKVIIIGSGFAGISAACFMAKAGWQVQVLEQHHQAGGRARQLKEQGFTFDMGPSWYWMPDVFDWFFSQFGNNKSAPYKLYRLDPSYRVYWKDRYDEMPASYTALQSLFEKIEPGAAASLDKFLEEAAYKYDVGIHKLVHKPGIKINELMDLDLMKGLFRLDVFTSMRSHVQKFFKNDQLRQLLEFPVLFLGALPQQIPALYSLMNYADIKLGTWYPEGGMHSIVTSMQKQAEELGVQFLFNEKVTAINTENGKAKSISVLAAGQAKTYEADVVIANADYAFVEKELLQENERNYSDAYWDKRVMAPSSLIFYVGLNKKLKNVAHHNLFFDVDFNKHGDEIYKTKQWPQDPLFYLSVTSVTDADVAPAGHENLFILIPIAAGLEGDDEALREHYFSKIVKRIEDRLGEEIVSNIVYKKSYSVSDFVLDYNAYKGNAYGLANTLMQTAHLKPSLKSKKIKNLYFTGQLTVPGPGVPPSLISGKVVSDEIIKSTK